MRNNANAPAFAEAQEMRVSENAPWHAHVYYGADDRPAAERLRVRFEEIAADAPILYVGRMVDRAVGPHPIPQFEIHFPASAKAAVADAIEQTDLRALIHPLTDDDVAGKDRGVAEVVRIVGRRHIRGRRGGSLGLVRAATRRERGANEGDQRGKAGHDGAVLAQDRASRQAVT